MKLRRLNRVVDGVLYAAGFFLFNFVLGMVFSLVASCTPRNAIAETITKLGEAGANMPRYVIAVLGTGYDASRATTPAILCKTGHYDYLSGKPIIASSDPHETRVINLIAEKLKGVDYCILVYQVWKNNWDFELDAFADALERAHDSGANLMNISMGWKLTRYGIIEKQLELNDEAKITTFIAAGNDGWNLDKDCVAYPMCCNLKHAVVVGMQDTKDPKKHDPDSNYGKRVSIWAPGWYKDKLEERSGTSYAAPRALAEYVLFLESKRKAAEKSK